MLTARERAASTYAAVLAQGRGRTLGAEDWQEAEIREARLANVRTAKRSITAARGTERTLLQEPDDARLDQMLAGVALLEARLAPSCDVQRPGPVQPAIAHGNGSSGT